MYKMLTMELLTDIWSSKTGGQLWKDKKGYNVSYKAGESKVYTYKASNLMQLAKKLDIIKECNSKLDKINIYTEHLYKSIAEYKEDINKLNPADTETFDPWGFGGTYEEHKNYLQQELDNLKFRLNNWSLEKECYF